MFRLRLSVCLSVCLSVHLSLSLVLVVCHKLLKNYQELHRFIRYHLKTTTARKVTNPAKTRPDSIGPIE